MIFGLISRVREVIKPVHATAKEFSLDKIQEIEQSSKDTALDQLMNAIVDRYARLQEAVGPAKVIPQSE